MDGLARNLKKGPEAISLVSVIPEPSEGIAEPSKT